MATPSAPRPYRDYLIPRLHERFSKTALYTLPACYLAAISMSSWGLFMWLPRGLTVIRALLNLVSVLMVLIVRISNVHLGARNTQYPARTAAALLWSLRWHHTLLWYSLSAWLFSEVYIWSAADNMALGWIDQGKSYERPKLNERPIYIRTIFFLLAVAHAYMHLYKDYDHTPIPSDEAPKPTRAPTEQAQPPNQQSLVESYLPTIQKGFHNIVNIAPWRVGYIVLVTVLYFVPYVPIRWVAVEIHRIIAQQNPMWTLPKYGEISSFKEKGHLILVTIFYGLVLNMIWEACNLAFSVLVVGPPLKSGKLITSVSPDPNLTLIMGLKARRELVRNMAFWELALLTKDFPDRRQAIYAEFDRAGGKGSSWSQVFAACREEINGIDKRVNPPQAQAVPQPEIQSLPKISDQGVLADIISTDPPKTSRPHEAAFSKFAKSIGQSPGSPPPFVAPGKKLIAALPESTSIQNIDVKRKDAVDILIRSWAGWPFRQTFARDANATIHGAPIGRESSIRHAAAGLSQLVVHSLKEDTYGQVQKDVPEVIKVYVKNIKAVEKFLTSAQPHWTDVTFKAADRNVPEVQETLRVLKVGLEGVLGAFAEYMQDVGLTMGEVAEARRLASQGVEMEQRR